MEKYEGKSVIDAFFWRFGDLVQAGAIYVGLNWFDFGITQFALVNIALASVWIWLTVLIGQRYQYLARQHMMQPLKAGRPIPDVHAPAGRILQHVLTDDHFISGHPNASFKLSACLTDGNELPGWLKFDTVRRTFYGKVPNVIDLMSHIELTATDTNGTSVTSQFRIDHNQSTD